MDSFRHGFGYVLSASALLPVNLLQAMSDPIPRVMLLVVRQSGSTDIYVMLRAPDGSWSVNDKAEPEHAEGVASPLPDASFVIYSKSGRSCKADGNGLITSMNPTAESTKGRYLWITAGAKGAKCVVDITGERIGRIEWPSKTGKVERVSIVRKSGKTQSLASTNRKIDLCRFNVS